MKFKEIDEIFLGKRKTSKTNSKRRAGIALWLRPVSYTHLRAHETSLHLVCRLLLEKKIFGKENVGRHSSNPSSVQ